MTMAAEKTPKKPRVRNTWIARKRLGILQRRADFLEGRVADHDGDPNRDKAELAALTWAMKIVRQWIDEDPNKPSA